MRPTFTLFLCVFLTLASCGMAYEANKQQLLRTAKAGDYGPPPPANHQNIERSIILSTLKDPESARFQFAPLARDAIPQANLSPTPVLVWMQMVSVNAKNSYGGYTGAQDYYFCWRNGKVYAIG